MPLLEHSTGGCTLFAPATSPTQALPLGHVRSEQSAPRKATSPSIPLTHTHLSYSEQYPCPLQKFGHNDKLSNKHSNSTSALRYIRKIISPGSESTQTLRLYKSLSTSLNKKLNPKSPLSLSKSPETSPISFFRCTSLSPERFLFARARSKSSRFCKKQTN